MTNLEKKKFLGGGEGGGGGIFSHVPIACQFILQNLNEIYQIWCIFSTIDKIRSVTKLDESTTCHLNLNDDPLFMSTINLNKEIILLKQYKIEIPLKMISY